MSPSLIETVSLAPGTPHLLVLQAVSCIFLLNPFHLFFATPLSWCCHLGSYLQLTVLLILEWCYCLNYLSYVDATPHLRWQIHLISLDSHGFQMYLFGWQLCISIWSVQIIQKETYHLLNQLLLLFHSGSHFKALSSPHSPKLEMKKSFWMPSSALCLTSKPLLMPANISHISTSFLSWLPLPYSRLYYLSLGPLMWPPFS